MRKGILCVLAVSAARLAMGQGPASPELRQVMERLDRLEEQNRELLAEIRALHEQLAGGTASSVVSPPQPQAPDTPPPPPLAERVDVQEKRVAQLDQEKVGSDHRLPVTLTGMALFNAFWTGRGAGGADNPTAAVNPPGKQASGGATFRQSVLGIKFDGPEIPGGGKVTGSVYADFFGGSGASLGQTVRLRVASVDAAWKNTTLSFALDKPIIAPREPDSLAQVGVSPLTGAGNLWLWQPQVRIEERFAVGAHSGVRAQFGIYQTSEGGTGLTTDYGDTLAKSRPGYEGRFEFWSASGENRRIEIAPGFHVSSTRVVGVSVPSRIFSVDWLVRPVSRVDISGVFFSGENMGVVGGLRQGVSVVAGRVRPVQGVGGWAQIKVRLAPRLTFNLYGGQEDDNNRDLERGGIAKNQGYAANLMYRFGSNILASFESSQVRTTYLNSGTRLFPHYDLAIAYLF